MRVVVGTVSGFALAAIIGLCVHLVTGSDSASGKVLGREDAYTACYLALGVTDVPRDDVVYVEDGSGWVLRGQYNVHFANGTEQGLKPWECMVNEMGDVTEMATSLNRWNPSVDEESSASEADSQSFKSAWEKGPDIDARTGRTPDHVLHGLAISVATCWSMNDAQYPDNLESVKRCDPYWDDDIAAAIDVVCWNSTGETLDFAVAFRDFQGRFGVYTSIPERTLTVVESDTPPSCE